MLSWAEFRGGLLALCGVLVLVLAVIAVSPGLPGELLLQSLRFHIVVGGLILVAATMIAGAPRRGLVVLLIVLASAMQGGWFVWEFYARRVPIAVEPAGQFRFLSFNVLVDNPRAEDLVERVLADPPDMMLVMETPGIERYLDRLDAAFPYRIGCSDRASCDISLYSRIPLENAKIHGLPPFYRQRLVLADIVVGGQKMTIAGIHLSKPYFDNAGNVELYTLHDYLARITWPVLIAGDFNSAAWSEPLALLGREDGLVPGPWMPATWPVRFGPLGVPIDNMFTRGNARILSLEAGDNIGSNHRPLWAEVAVYPGS